MRREDVRPLLVKVTDQLPEPDLADAAWAGGLALRRRQRRTVTIGVLLVIVVLVVLSALIGLGRL